MNMSPTSSPVTVPPVSHPERPTLSKLRRIFQDASGVDLSRATPSASFADLGLQAPSLARASAAASERFGVEVTARQLHQELPNLARLADYVDELLLAGRSGDLDKPAVAVVEHCVALTDAQREIWWACQFGPAASAAYNESFTLRLNGPLEPASLRRALAQLIARHEALRTTFSATGDVQRIASWAPVTLGSSDFSREPAAGRAAAVARCAEEIANAGFDLVNGPLFRAALIRQEPDSHLLVFAAHHLVCDGWSLAVLQRELGELYSADVLGRPAVLSEAPSFSAYAERQAEMRASASFAAAEQFWIGQFSDGVPPIELPVDRPRGGERTYAGSFFARSFAPDVANGIKQMCAEQGCTVFTALLGAFQVLLHRLSGHDDLVVGVPAAAQVMGGLGNAVGHFANLLPVRMRLRPEQRFSELLGAARQHVTDALEHWRYPFGRLLQQLNVARDGSRIPLAPVVFNTVRHRGSVGFVGLAVEPENTPKRFVNFELSFNFALTEQSITLGCHYSTELYDDATIARWFGHFETLLRGIVANSESTVAELPLLTDTERQQLLLTWNNTAVDYERESSIPALFERQAALQPGAVAIVGRQERWTYDELNRRADAIADFLRRRGVGADMRVGIFLERSPLLVAAMLGVLKAGAAYVPLDRAHPKERLVFIAGDTAMPVILTQGSLHSHLPVGDWESVALDNDPRLSRPARRQDVEPPAAESLAYVIYTSGSTGRPKGVCVTHRGVVALTAWARQNYRPEELAGVLFATSASFDVSVFETLVPLCLGGRIIVAGNILEAGDLPARSEVTLLSGVPSAVTELVRGHLVPPSVRTVNLAGEACPQSLVDALYALPHIERVFDLYGPTETTVYSTGGLRVRGGRPNIGRPLANERAYILDARMQPVPVGVRGELYLGGDKLARGYLNLPKLTRERFSEAPFLPGHRIYRTGDAARFLADGTIEFLGRLDHQVKIRGYRIELGEIESVLAQHPAVAEGVVVARSDAAGARLLGYVVPAAGTVADLAALRAHLAERLPEYMLPAALTVLEKLPRTTSGKIDRKALPDPDFSAGRSSFVAPRSTAEELLADIWRDVLGVKQVGAHDGFFELGGHSLLAAQVIARLHAVLNVEVSLQQFFAAPTVAGLAPVIEVALLEQINGGSASSGATVPCPPLAAPEHNRP